MRVQLDNANILDIYTKLELNFHPIRLQSTYTSGRDVLRSFVRSRSSPQKRERESARERKTAPRS